MELDGSFHENETQENPGRVKELNLVAIDFGDERFLSYVTRLFRCGGKVQITTEDETYRADIAPQDFTTTRT